MKFAVALFVVAVGSSALASQPGQPLDCSDWVFLKPGFACIQAPPQTCPGPHFCDADLTSAPDNEHHIVYLKQVPNGGCSNGTLYRTELIQADLTSGAESVVGYLDDRCAEGCIYRLGVYGAGDYMRLWFDSTSGALTAIVDSYLQDSGSTNCPYAPQRHDAPMTFTGFATLFEVVQEYTPSSTTLSFRVPYMPEGMAAADHFDTYWGPLTKPIDFTQAHPLACDYPTAPPHVGDYLSVTDTIPTPAPGQGVYYITSATYQGTTRYGRKTTAGRLSGRDPALLPACVQP